MGGSKSLKCHDFHGGEQRININESIIDLPGKLRSRGRWEEIRPAENLTESHKGR